MTTAAELTITMTMSMLTTSTEFSTNEIIWISWRWWLSWQLYWQNYRRWQQLWLQRPWRWWWWQLQKLNFERRTSLIKAIYVIFVKYLLITTNPLYRIPTGDVNIDDNDNDNLNKNFINFHRHFYQIFMCYWWWWILPV